MEKQRLTAKKASIAEIVGGRFVQKGGLESSYVLTALGRRLSRVRIMGLVVDKFVSPDEKYATITLDDGTETIRCKSFVNIKIFDNLASGDLVDVFGKVRIYDGEVYVTPEIVRKVPANAEILRMLELEHIYIKQKQLSKRVAEIAKTTADAAEVKRLAAQFAAPQDVEGVLEAEEVAKATVEENMASAVENRNKILSLIIQLDTGNGTDYTELTAKSGIPEAAVEAAVQHLLESGICFEPRPGKIKKL
ncbi:MAG: OB-fold nucleic acid binding domain-containing protein [Candidatus Aenigmatarchaeota archaeon]|nr:hypothetical protein [Candidatus Aenigmarchaeota archaeon]